MLIKGKQCFVTVVKIVVVVVVVVLMVEKKKKGKTGASFQIL
jgi:preprotein translocase subunit SecG